MNQTVEFFNIDTGKKEYYYPLTGEFKDPFDSYKVLVTTTPAYNKDCITTYKRDNITGEIIAKQKPVYDKNKLDYGMVLNRNTGEIYLDLERLQRTCEIWQYLEDGQCKTNKYL